MAVPQGRNLRCSLDFMIDRLVSGRRFHILTLVDCVTRECPGLVLDRSLTGLRVVRELDRVAELRGYEISARSSGWDADIHSPTDGIEHRDDELENVPHLGRERHNKTVYGRRIQ
jgi:transposase InsO family protein